MPRFEKKQRIAVVRAVTDVSNSPISMGIKGFTATLSGKVPDEESKLAVLDSVGVHTGIFSLRDQLSVAEAPAEQPRQGIDTAIATLVKKTNSTTIPLRNAENSKTEPLDVADAEDVTPSSLNFSVNGDILSVSGVLAPEDDSLSLIKLAMDSFGIDVVSNGIIVDDSAAPSEWLDSLESLLPVLGSLQQAELDINDRRIILSGVVPDRETHDALVNEALTRTGDMNLLERIAIGETLLAEKAATELQIATAAQASEALQAAEEARLAEEARVAEEARIAEEAKAAEKARLAEEARVAEEARIAEEAKAAEEARLAEEARVAEEARIAEEAKAAEEARLAEEARVAEETRIAEEAKAAEKARKAEDAKDTEEVNPAENSTDPLDQQPAPDNDAQLRKALSELSSLRIQFESESSVIAEESLEILNQIADVLISFPETIVSIEGHTDSTGMSESNLALSLARATTVRSYLVDRGVSVFMLRAKGFGENMPIAENESAAGRATNRRIEFKF